MEARQTLAPGTTVCSSEGEQIGTIQSSDNSSFLMESGVPIPLSAISMSREGEVHLSLTKADVLDLHWTDQPGGQMTPDPGAETASDYSAVQEEDSLEEDPMPTPGQEPASGSPTRRPVVGDPLERPSGTTGPIVDGRA